MEDTRREHQAMIITLILACAFVALAGRVGYLQVIRGEELNQTAATQRLKELSLPPRRGDITDRNGEPLATTRPSFNVSLIYTGTDYSEAQKALLEQILGLDRRAVDKTIAQLIDFPFKAALLKGDVSETELTLIHENLFRLPGVLVETRAVRIYPHGSLAAHVLGYIRLINEQQLIAWADRGYDNQDVVGYDGLESLQAFDPYLQGEDGFQWVEVDSRGRPTKRLGREDPVPGGGLVTTIDYRLQETAERALDATLASLQAGKDPVLRDRRTGLPVPFGKPGLEVPIQEGPLKNARAGAVVALDVRTGAVLAMASQPTFDPNVFALSAYLRPGSARQREYQDYLLNILQDREARPLLNRAIGEVYPPGSTFKPITALAALQADRVLGGVFCSGGYRAYGRVWGDWAAHGRVDFLSAMAQSCDVYFYQLAQNLGVRDNPTAAMAKYFGLDEPTALLGVPPGSERSGRVPTADLLRARYPEERGNMGWFPGDTLNVAIGQGPQAYTPLQLANYVATLANGGRRMRPYLVERVLSPEGKIVAEFGPLVLSTVPVDPEDIELVHRGMLGVTRPGGTAYWRFSDWAAYGFPVQVAAKTGTAEVGTGKGSHGLFVAFAPYEDPEIAIAVVVEHGGGGSSAAAPVARAILDEYFGYLNYWESRQPGGKAAGGENSVQDLP